MVRKTKTKSYSTALAINEDDVKTLAERITSAERLSRHLAYPKEDLGKDRV
jgi:hypothetical protein